MKDFLLESFPNPERKGCPDEDTLQALAEDRLPPNHTALLHVGSCSECYAEYLHLRQDFEESNKQLSPSLVQNQVPVATVKQPERTVPFPPRSKAGALAAAAVLLVFLGGGGFYLFHGNQSSIPTGTLIGSSTPVGVEVNLYSAITTRGAGDGATPLEQVSLPAGVVNLRVTLPRYSETGSYKILVSKDRAGQQPVAKGMGVAAESNGKVLLPVTLDLRAANPGAYFLATVRGSDNETYYYPLQVK